MNHRIILLATLSLLFGFSALSAVSRGVSADGGVGPTATPTPPRPRVVVTTPTPIPSATVSVTPSPTPAKQVQTLASLQSKISGRLLSANVARGRVGIKILSLNSGKVIFENDAEKYFTPASNMKNFTVATALERLGPNFRFETKAFANALPDASGTINGDLRIFGGGDVSVSTAFYLGDYYKGVDALVDELAKAGVKKISGGLVGDLSYFSGGEIPETWEWDDLQWYYGAGISALPINDNAVDVKVSPTQAGQPCDVRLLPRSTVFTVNNLCTTGGSVSALSITKSLDRNILTVGGTIPAGSKSWEGSIAVTQPADLFLALLKERLIARGIAVVGDTRIQPLGVTPPTAQTLIATLQSPPFGIIAAKTMKPSQNMYTETILWTLGEEKRRNRATAVSGNSGAIGIAVVKDFLTEDVGIPKDSVIQYDGSGLSRHDLVTPSAVAALYVYMAKVSKNAQVWRDSLAVGGVDGTLKRRFAGTAVSGNFRGKTGTLDQISALSGYVRTAGGDELVISIIVNNVPSPSERIPLIDDIVVSLANFDGKVDEQ
ncbi:MAG TPA: D-alanyl-D-alanine carboxypeptidase/D-alanyl-D-alanine-endopeptidase [Pyrinomonadaceae bacterium]|nr:D-alanyl-D-alanine carboxypeptidase/D-alanyl-D-alanine-endopeptidase [Pyrinomonadaceae bacterium]